MTIGFIGDIIGKPGRDIIAQYLPKLRSEFGIDFVIANYENASHGFGLSAKNAEELFAYGIDMMTGGNHSFDKKEIIPLFETQPIIRPLNYPEAMPGNGIFHTTVLNTSMAIVNLMGHYAMPMVDNPFTIITKTIQQLQYEGIKHIIIDMHAEATSEKQALLHLLKNKVSAIMGTHTHVGTDDLSIFDGCCYVTDVGLSGCRDGVIGMDIKAPLNRFLTGIGEYFDVPKDCKSILQMIVFTLDDYGRCIEAKKIKYYDSGERIITQAFMEISN
ncbi:MAG: TIGR00282 family metallophosphoesterase [Sulfurovaceae bacterium]|nr:TIGR00282 family metallophosphoesterase [Sulfurovaceae bacterium]